MQESPSNNAATQPPSPDSDTDFPGTLAPFLEGEARCLCGELEGAHDALGACPSTGCVHFYADDGREETTNGDGLVVEYDPGVEPIGRAG